MESKFYIAKKSQGSEIGKLPHPSYYKKKKTFHFDNMKINTF